MTWKGTSTKGPAILSPVLSPISHSVFTLLLWKLCYGCKTEGGEREIVERSGEGLLTRNKKRLGNEGKFSISAKHFNLEGILYYHRYS